ncbi:hypothetical protein R4P64_33360 [Rhodococcus sp. IEGM 1366]|uniref:hypothetical protein n=1 Tax=Rhodococcus sp. IEGM 1366 TaxID=3082223 RepID=UPI002954BC1A|nr:hypothetical protein [Rhodococcus sp. IEGM 1366]MDV8071402.1 hypothetical protein [Rhodococcus sp. IEGM 1366]
MNTVVSGRELRPLGAFERIIDLYMYRNPVQFSLAVECGRVVSESEVKVALSRLQTAHPLLAAMIDRSGSRPVFRHTDGAIGVRIALDSTWQEQAAVEQSIAIAPSPGPLVRVVLLPDAPTPERTTIVLTFSHQVTDGRGALRAAHDLLAAVGGRDIGVRNLPRAQEDLMRQLDTEPEPSEQNEAAGGEHPAARLRPFDENTPPAVEHADLDEATTLRIRRSARSRSCTVQSMLCAGAALTLFERSDRQRVRINVPIDLRRAVGLEDDVAIRFTATCIVLCRPSLPDFWELAAVAAAQLAAARTWDVTRKSVLALASLDVGDADDAEQAMLAATNADIEITNLGIADSETDDDLEQAIWGPVMSTQVDHEQILGVITRGGRLRMTMTSHEAAAGLLSGIVAQLTSAVS